MSAWQGGYEPRRLDMAPKYGYCPDCKEPIHNRGAHAEACTGAPRRRLCGTRLWQQGNTYLNCQRPAGHEGGHEFR